MQKDRMKNILSLAFVLMTAVSARGQNEALELKVETNSPLITLYEPIALKIVLSNVGIETIETR